MTAFSRSVSSRDSADDPDKAGSLVVFCFREVGLSEPIRTEPLPLIRYFICSTNRSGWLLQVGFGRFSHLELGHPFTDGGFGNKFRDWCDQANLPHCSAHGLRKAGATIAANNGATARQLMAIFGWDTIKQAEHYTRKADQTKLAQAAMHLLLDNG